MYRLSCRMLFLSALGIFIRPARVSLLSRMHRLSQYISREERSVYRNWLFAVFLCRKISLCNGDVSASSVPFCSKKNNIFLLTFLLYLIPTGQ
jgi:hypothetical protein